ncbi:hypothetical protein [Shewanella waksmanii]|uniref:hypothetical protein n=1 Tax=Shewanella waksmanii TaxID=213783 RepID=UPI0004AEC6C8|nr:hypothetical protein [Shewanella waksmanii]
MASFFFGYVFDFRNYQPSAALSDKEDENLEKPTTLPAKASGARLCSITISTAKP